MRRYEKTGVPGLDVPTFVGYFMLRLYAQMHECGIFSTFQVATCFFGKCRFGFDDSFFMTQILISVEVEPPVLPIKLHSYVVETTILLKNSHWLHRKFEALQDLLCPRHAYNGFEPQHPPWVGPSGGASRGMITSLYVYTHKYISICVFIHIFIYT